LLDRETFTGACLMAFVGAHNVSFRRPGPSSLAIYPTVSVTNRHALDM
jgi:hypothetical protein